MAVDVSGLNVAVSGAARGIGAATAAAFHAAGANVAIGDIDDTALKETADRLHLQTFGHLDVTDSKSFDGFLCQAEERMGPLDVLVNNAGIMPVGSITAEDDETARRIININVHGVINGTKLALTGMVSRGRGHIVNVASMAGENYCPGAATYCASKYAVVGFTDSVRLEVRNTGVALSVILPAFVNTELTSGSKGMRGIKKVEPSAIADAIVGVVKHPRPHVYVPGAVGLLMKAGGVLPMRAREPMLRYFGADEMFFSDLDVNARRAYDERVRRS